MPTVFTRLYADQGQASKVVSALQEAGYYDTQYDLFAEASASPAPAAPEADTEGVMAAVEAPPPASEEPGALQGRLKEAGVYATAASIYADEIAKGRALVVVRAPFGQAAPVAPIMDEFNPIETDVKFTQRLAPTEKKKPANIIRVSKRRKSLPKQKGFSKPARKISPTFLSGMVGLPVLKTPKKGGDNLIKKNRNITARFGMGMLIKPPRAEENLIKDPTPLSTTFGLKTIIKKRARVRG